MNSTTEPGTRLTFVEELKQQRWDDHRFYHQSRVTQSLHLFSALCFLVSYVLLLLNHAVAASLFGWTIAMWSRQIGHFFFEPTGFDHINNVTFDHKEDVKVGYNLRRKVTLFATWLSVPLLLWIDPTLWGLLARFEGYSFFDRLGIVWLLLGFTGLFLRTFWLCVTRGIQTGLVWFTKILTDPFHDVRIYHMAPVWLLRGQWFDPMEHAQDSH
jgi:hypothetical protein